MLQIFVDGSMKSLYLFVFLSLTPITLIGQKIDNMASFRDIKNDHYFRFNYDNDYFTKTDNYYTQGINIEYVHPVLQKFPLTGLLAKLPGSNYKYGLSIDLAGYTPTSIAYLVRRPSLCCQSYFKNV